MHTQQNAITTERDTRPAHMRLGEKKLSHVKAVANYLATQFNSHQEIRDVIMLSTDAPQLASYLRTRFAAVFIDQAHAAVVASYQTMHQNNGHHYKRGRGRPMGSKNKPKNVVPATPEEIFGGDTTPAPAPIEPAPAPAQSPTMTSAELAATITSILEQVLMPWDAKNVAEHQQIASVTDRVRNALENVRLDLETLTDKVSRIVDHRPTVVELVRPDMPTVNMGVQHKNFPLLLKMATAALRNKQHLNLWVYGPAGTGKSYAAEMVAKALDLKFYTNGALNAPHEVLGFNNAHQYVTTAFRQAWEHGGVYCFDEIDASNPSAIMALNGALAGTICSFPDAMVPRHKDCIIIATANTVGHGASAEYSARFKQDASSADRFVFVNWPIDEALEASMCGNQDWVRTVQKYRANAAKHKIPGLLITPRATLYGESLLAAGLEIEHVIKAVVRKGLNDAQWALINA